MTRCSSWSSLYGQRGPALFYLQHTEKKKISLNWMRWTTNASLDTKKKKKIFSIISSCTGGECDSCMCKHEHLFALTSSIRTEGFVQLVCTVTKHRGEVIQTQKEAEKYLTDDSKKNEIAQFPTIYQCIPWAFRLVSINISTVWNSVCRALKPVW